MSSADADFSELFVREFVVVLVGAVGGICVFELLNSTSISDTRRFLWSCFDV